MRDVVLQPYAGYWAFAEISRIHDLQKNAPNRINPSKLVDNASQTALLLYLLSSSCNGVASGKQEILTHAIG